jgi:hypothetical protein
MWTIEQVTPGEKPVPVPFYGSRAEAEAEVRRLNSGGKIEVKALAARPRKRQAKGRRHPAEKSNRSKSGA